MASEGDRKENKESMRGRQEHGIDALRRGKPPIDEEAISTQCSKGRKPEEGERPSTNKEDEGNQGEEQSANVAWARPTRGSERHIEEEGISTLSKRATTSRKPLHKARNTLARRAWANNRCAAGIARSAPPRNTAGGGEGQRRVPIGVETLVREACAMQCAHEALFSALHPCFACGVITATTYAKLALIQL